MSLLRIALRLIFRVDIRFHYASGWTRMTWGGTPRAAHQFYLPQHLEDDATPVICRTDRAQPALALAAALVTQNTELPEAIAAQPVRTKQPS